MNINHDIKLLFMLIIMLTFILNTWVSCIMKPCTHCWFFTLLQHSRKSVTLWKELHMLQTHCDLQAVTGTWNLFIMCDPNAHISFISVLYLTLITWRMARYQRNHHCSSLYTLSPHQYRSLSATGTLSLKRRWNFSGVVDEPNIKHENKS